MTLFSKLFGSGNGQSEDTPQIPWKSLTSIAQLEDIIEESKTKTVAIFKHSTRCGISSMTLRRFEGDYDTDITNVAPYYLDLLQFRDVSNEISARFGVMHQSPQLLVIKNGETIHHASHYDIQAQTIINLA
ncbi:MAG: bacillithiol system redox-active protein YtxJ [Gilvibacter sp.]